MIGYPRSNLRSEATPGLSPRAGGCQSDWRLLAGISHLLEAVCRGQHGNSMAHGAQGPRTDLVAPQF